MVSICITKNSEYHLHIGGGKWLRLYYPPCRIGTPYPTIYLGCSYHIIETLHCQAKEKDPLA